MDRRLAERRKPIVIAHRGASAQRPENTHGAFALAVGQGADMLELDLHQTRDGAIVVVHDAELDRIGGRGTIAEATEREIRSLDVGNGEAVPVLEEVLDRFASQIELNLELKVGPAGRYPTLEADVFSAVKTRGQLDRVLFSSFETGILERLRALAPSARIGVLAARRPRRGALERALATSRRLGAEALHPAAALVDANWVEAAHAERLAVYPFTIDDPTRCRRLLKLGVDGIFTNRPDRLRTLVDSLF